MYNKFGGNMNIRIKKLDDFGRGICFINDKITFIPNSLEDEVIEYKIIKEKKKYNDGKALRIFNVSNDRIRPICLHYLKCGGCHLEHMSLIKENNFKVEKVKSILSKFAKIEIDSLNIISGKYYNYRNKIVLKVENGIFGLLEEGSNNLVEIDKCYLINDEMNERLELLKHLVKRESGISKIMMRLGNKSGEIMLHIKGNVNNKKPFGDICDSLIINDEVITKEYITSYIMDKKFNIRKESFFQVNDEIVEKLYSYVRDITLLLSSKIVLDLYCGVGTIGIIVSDLVEKVVGVEVVEEAVVDANQNKRLNNIKNIEFINSKVEDVISNFNNEFDTVIVDPPRSGLDRKTKDVLLKEKFKNIIYISCDAVTLARDLFELSTVYNFKSIELFNMFPRTYHVECVCVLNR